METKLSDIIQQIDCISQATLRYVATFLPVSGKPFQSQKGFNAQPCKFILKPVQDVAEDARNGRWWSPTL